MEDCPKRCFFLGNSMTIKLRNLANFIVRNFVVIWEAPTVENWSLENSPGASPQTPAPALDSISGAKGAEIVSSTVVFKLNCRQTLTQRTLPY